MASDSDAEDFPIDVLDHEEDVKRFEQRPASLRSASALVSEILILYIRTSEQDVNAVAKVKKRMGRPPVGWKPITVKVPPTQLARLKGRIKSQPDKPTLPEALRRLADEAIACAEKAEART